MYQWQHAMADIKKKAPFRAFISASNEVYDEEILESYERFFQGLAEKADILRAYIDLIEKEDRFFYKDCRKVWDELMSSTFDKLKNDKSTKQKFEQKIEQDWMSLQKVENLPAFEKFKPELERMQALVLGNIILETKPNFFFGKAKI